MSNRSAPSAPSDITGNAMDLERLADLRARAASRLTGAAAAKGAIAGATDALAVLHALASSPDTASDALTLLHELQVHQVELDLQAQELLESRGELEAALRRQIDRCDHQPAGCCSIDAHGLMHELNQTGAGMLGISSDDALGLALDAWVCAESARRLQAAIASLDADAGLQRASCRLTLRPGEGPGRPVIASIGRDPGGRGHLVSWVEAGDDPELRPAVH